MATGQQPRVAQPSFVYPAQQQPWAAQPAMPPPLGQVVTAQPGAGPPRVQAAVLAGGAAAGGALCGAAIGGLFGGPIGLVVGAFTGAWMSSHKHKHKQPPGQLGEAPLQLGIRAVYLPGVTVIHCGITFYAVDVVPVGGQHGWRSFRRYTEFRGLRRSLNMTRGANCNAFAFPS